MTRRNVRFVNVGAINPDTGDRFVTKAALKRAAATGQVAFDQIAYPHNDLLPGIIEPKDIIQEIELNVVGPDPYNKRNWYAGVHLGNDGKLKVT